MKHQVIERILAVMLSVAIILSSMGSYSVNATQVNAAGNTSVTDSENAAEGTENNGEAVESTAAGLLEGDGTKENPFKVSSVEDFEKMQKIINDANLTEKNFVLTGDINFAEASNFKPIENFVGVFDGNGFTLKNINITTEGSAGLFSTVGDNAVIKNLNLENPQIKGSDGVGALIGIAGENTVIESCYVVGGNVSGSTVGGIVGYVSGGKIKSSYVSVTVDGSNVVGGIAGMSGADITDTFAYGKVNAVIENVVHAGVGGLVGVVKGGKVVDCAALNDVTVSKIADYTVPNTVVGVGGLVGFAQGSLIDESFSSGKVVVSSAGVTDSNSVIGIGGLAGVATCEIKNSYSSSAVWADFVAQAKGDSVRTLGGLIGAAYGNVNNCYASGGIAATFNGGKISLRDCYLGGAIGSVAGKDYSNIYFDKDMNNQKDLKAVSNFDSETVKGLRTKELCAVKSISKSFELGEGNYPYIKSMVETQAGAYSTVLSVVVTTVSEKDKSLELGVGVSKAVNVPESVTLGENKYPLTWVATSTAAFDGKLANVVRTGVCANYMTLTLCVGNAYKSYSRLYTDIGAYEANLGNTEISYTLNNKSGDREIDKSLVGVLIKSKQFDGTVVSNDAFMKSGETIKLNKISVSTGGFYVDVDVKSGYKVEIIAKDSTGNELKATDMGNLGIYVETGSAKFVSLQLNIVKAEMPWGLTSIWQSITR